MLGRVNKFNPRCTKARLVGFCLMSSRYIVVDFDGRFRMVRTIKRASADDRWKVVSPRDPFSAADLDSTPAEFTCSRGTRGEGNPTAQHLERTWLTLSRPIQIMTLFREGCTSSREISWHMGRRITARVAEHWSVVAVHEAPLRNVKFSLKESSRKRRRGKPVFAQQPVGCVMLHGACVEESSICREPSR